MPEAIEKNGLNHELWIHLGDCLALKTLQTLQAIPRAIS